MEIFIRDKKVDFEIENEKTVGELLGSIETACEASGMTITGISADGVSVLADKLDAFFKRDYQSISRIDLETISGTDVLDRLRLLGTRFTGFVPQLQNISVLLQTGKDLEVMQTINAFSLDLQTLYQLIPLLNITARPPADFSIDGTSLETFPTELAPILTELLSAMEKKDTVLVGDLAEYELAPRIEKLGTTLASV